MLGLIFILLLVGLALGVFFWAGTLWFQAYIYSEPTEDLYWRAPAAAAALTVFLALWCVLAYRQLGGGYDPLFFSAEQEKVHDRFWSVEKDGEKVLYERHNTGSLLSNTEYLSRSGRSPRPWKRNDSEGRLVQAIVVQEGPEKKEVRFKLQDPAAGKFKEGELARYVEEGGARRVMTEDRIGRVATQRSGLIVMYLVLNLLHFGVWFVCLWLLLRFQWLHALGLAVVFWLIMTLWILPQVLRRAEEAAPPRAAPATARWEMPSQPECRMCMMTPSWTT